MILHSQRWLGDDADAPTVVCLHGITSWSGRFRRLAQERLRSWNVLALDLRGHGDSGWEPPWDIAAHVSDIIDTVAAPSTWIGHSFGGRLIVELASRNPELVQRAVLLDPAIRVRSSDAYAQAEAVRCEQRFASVDDYVDSRLAGNTIFLASRDFLKEEVEDDLAPADDGEGYVPRFSRSAAVTGWSEMATESSPMPACPTLVITGERSWMRYEPDPASHQIGQIDVVTVPGGHSILWDAFDEAADAIVRFLNTGSK